jgi:hypothetical protein
VYSLTVTLFSLLLGTGLGAFASRRIPSARVRAVTVRAVMAVAGVAVSAPFLLPFLISVAIPWPLWLRIVTAVVLLLPLGFLLGIPLPGGMRLLASRSPEIIPWGWGLNGAFSVIGATLAVFIAMNWGFSTALFTGAVVYTGAAAALGTSTRG